MELRRSSYIYLSSKRIESMSITYHSLKRWFLTWFHQILDHSGVWPKVSLVFEDFKFKISEG